MDLQEQAVRGVFLTGSAQFVQQGIQFVNAIILARLLLPSDFGLVSMVAVFTGILGITRNWGMDAALIQRKEVDDICFSTVFWSVLVSGFGLFLLGIVAAPLVALFYNEQLLQPLMIVSSLTFIIRTLGMTPNAMLLRNLAFKKIAQINITSTVTGSIVSIGLALASAGPWSIVIGQIAAFSTITILAWIVINKLPKLCFDLQIFRQMAKFGLNFLGFRMTDYVRSQIDYLLIGKFFGATSLGYYTLANTLITLPQRKISGIMSGVTFPTFSKIQDNNAGICKGYTKSVLATALISFPLLIGLFCLADSFVYMVYGEKWMQIVLPVKILVIFGLVSSLTALQGSIFLSKGRTDLLFRIGVCSSIACTVAIIIGTKWGLLGVITALTIIMTIIGYISQIIVNQLIKLPLKDFFGSLRTPFIASIVMGTVLLFCRDKIAAINSLSHLQMLLVMIPVGALIYLITLRLIAYDLLKDLLSKIKFLRR